MGLSPGATSTSKMASNDALACTYAALILHDDGIPISGDKIASVCKSAGVAVETYWPSLFANMLKDKNVEEMLMSSAAAPAPAAGGAAAPADAGAAAGGGGGKKKAPEPEPEE